MQSPDRAESSSDPEILAARGRVELAKAELENRLYQAGESSRQALGRMVRKTAPVLVLAAAIVGTVVVVRLVRAASKGRRPKRFADDESNDATPLYKVALGAALRGIVRAVAARMAEQAAAHLLAASEERSLEPNGAEVHAEPR